MTDQGTPPGDGQANAGEAAGGTWVSVAEAARRLGVTPRAIRNRIGRDTIVWRPRGNEGREVYLPDGAGQGDGSGDDPGDDQGDALAELRAELHRERERREAAELRAAVAVREVELTRELLAEVKADRDRMEELLRVALDRPSPLMRLVRALRSPRSGVSGPTVGK